VTRAETTETLAAGAADWLVASGTSTETGLTWPIIRNPPRVAAVRPGEQRGGPDLRHQLAGPPDDEAGIAGRAAGWERPGSG
jgi:hypothetical protein